MKLRVLALTAFLIAVGQAGAQTTLPRIPWLSPRTCPSVGCCPDDYCHKPYPVLLPFLRCGSADDYCKKPMPCLTDVQRHGSCDDYCRKTLPNFLCPPLAPYMSCGPTPCVSPRPR